MNTFRRNERFQEHLISALPQRYLCSECNGALLYAGDNECEKISCVKHPEHTGLVKIKDVMLVEQEHMLSRGVGVYQTLRNNPNLLQIFRARNAKAKALLFGDDE